MQMRAAIVGIGSLGFGSFGETGVLPLADSALQAALDDARLSRADVDGVVVHIGSPRGADCDEICRMLGIDARFVSQTWSHGRFGSTVLQHAAMALAHGLADCVLALGSFRNTAFPRHGQVGFPGFEENFREGGGPHAETPHAGLIAPIGGAALSAQRYFHQYGVDREKLAAVALAQRKAAVLNPHAFRRQPLTAQAYLDSPYVAEPLRRLDCSTPVDTSVAVLLTREDRARDLAQPPVFLHAYQGLHAGPNEFVFGQPGLGVNQRDVFAYQPAGRKEQVFAATGLGPEDIDTLHCYDGFSPQVLWTLERFGFAAPGCAADWIQDGRIELGGELPVNTSGGHLSEGHSNGWGQTVEIVRQLRGQAGPRQVQDCEFAMWATTFGDAIIYARQ
jgi:acetyl-CoA acetyltransferase